MVRGGTYWTVKEAAEVEDTPEIKLTFEIAGDPGGGFSPNGRTCLGLKRVGEGGDFLL